VVVQAVHLPSPTHLEVVKEKTQLHLDTQPQVVDQVAGVDPAPSLHSAVAQAVVKAEALPITVLHLEVVLQDKETLAAFGQVEVVKVVTHLVLVVAVQVVQVPIMHFKRVAQVAQVPYILSQVWLSTMQAVAVAVMLTIMQAQMVTQ
jgi:hypothetical protein